MPEMDKEQLKALREKVEEDYRRVEEDYRRAEENHRQAEENYRLDVAAIEHLQRRFFSPLSSIATIDYSSADVINSKPPVTIQIPQSLQPMSAAKASEEWEIFRSIHK
jgi:hypothetical protein